MITSYRWSIKTLLWPLSSSALSKSGKTCFVQIEIEIEIDGNVNKVTNVFTACWMKIPVTGFLEMGSGPVGVKTRTGFRG
jgi:primosomal replication protein N